MNLEQLQSSIGKRVSVKMADKSVVCGVLQFAGNNENFPSWGLQLTIDRMPITNVDVNNIELQAERVVIREKAVVSTEQIDEIAKEAFTKFGTTFDKLGNK